jgi:hypothetical protein
VTVRLGISDGNFVEVAGGDLRAGQPVIIGSPEPTAPATGLGGLRLRF